MAKELMPERRRRGVIEERIGNEVVVYDRSSHRAHSLNPPAALVWSLCDGKTPLTQVIAQYREATDSPAAEEVVTFALARLSKAGLLVERWESRQALVRLSRRDFARKLGVAAVLVPAVMTVMAPTPAMAATKLPNGSGCSSSVECASGCCCNDNSGGLKNTCVTLGLGCNVCR